MFLHCCHHVRCGRGHQCAEKSWHDQCDISLQSEFGERVINWSRLQSVCALLDHLADWGDLYLEKPRIDENPSGGQITAIDSSPTAQIRSVQTRRA